MYYVDFYSLFNNPENDWKTYLKEAADSPPGPTLLTEGACHAKNKLEVLFIDTSRNIYMLFFVLSDSNNLDYHFFGNCFIILSKSLSNCCISR